MADLTPLDGAGLVAAANERFYRAFESLDLAEMDAVWSHADDVLCIHPGWRLLAGWEAVRESWDAIFQSTREMRFSIGDVRAHVDGDLGWVSCTENILSEAGGQVGVTRLLATNLFARRQGAWLMVHHHASHILAAGAPGDA